MTDKLKPFLDGYIKTSEQLNKILVFPLMCGTGKSTCMKHYISDAIREHFGLIVVTDRIDNLEQFTTSHDDKEFNAFLKYNSYKIALLTSETIREEYRELYRKPIILMTTQRYFSLTVEEIRTLTEERKIILFDEKPCTLEVRKITIEGLNRIDTVINTALNDTVNQHRKDEFTNSYTVIKTELMQILKGNESENKNFVRDKLIYSDVFENTKNEITTFQNCFTKFRKLINASSPQSVKDIEAVIKLICSGGMATSKKKLNKKSENSYDNYFTAIINQADKLTEANANVFVFDGTAEISPDYKLNCFEMIDCSQFDRDLTNLTLDMIRLNTSKTNLTKSGSKTDATIREIINYLNAEPLNRCNVIFTYKQLEPKFKDCFVTEHFNNIKGTNRFKNENSLAQVGLNIYSHGVYFIVAGEIARYNHHQDLENVIGGFEISNETMCDSILADLEQNIFRGCIRDANSTERMKYTVFCNYAYQSTLTDGTSQLKGLVDCNRLKEKILNRYSKFGATVNFIDTPPEIERLNKLERKAKNKTAFQKYDEWVNSQTESRIVKAKKLKQEIGINDEQFKELKNTEYFNQSVKPTDTKGYYQIVI